MMYSNKLVCSVKASGKFLREDVRENESIVYLPFKTEYSIFLKNLASRRALVHVDIDGKNMTEGGLIVGAGQSIDLERPANFREGRKFKFIEKTSEISEFRGDHPEDGLIFVKWQFEIPPPPIIWNTPIWFGRPDYTSPVYPTYYNSNISYTASNIGSSSNTSGGDNFTRCCTNNVKLGASGPIGSKGVEGPPGFVGYAAAAPQGITVEGSKSKQNFSHGYIGNLEGTLYSMVIKLFGGPRPIYVREKIQCPTCGRRWPSNYEFCPNCSTAIK